MDAKRPDYGVKTPEATKKEVDTILRKIMDEDLSPKEAMGLSTDVVEGFYGQAYMLYNSGKYQEASQVFRLLITLDPTEFKYVLGLAASQHMLKDYPNAVLTYQLCAVLKPDNPLAQYHCSDCFMHMNDKQSARTCLQMAILAAGKNPEFKMIVDRCNLAIEGLKELKS